MGSASCRMKPSATRPVRARAFGPYPAIHTSSLPFLTQGMRILAPATSISLPSASSLITWMASSTWARVVGFLPNTRLAESPRPMPQMVRLPNMSLRVANSEAVTEGSPHDPPGRRENLRLKDLGLLPQDVRVERPRVREPEPFGSLR